jgi:hypothetical protein
MHTSQNVRKTHEEVVSVRTHVSSSKLMDGKGKVVPVLFELSATPWRHTEEWKYSSTHSLTSALHGGEWSASRLGLFTPRERAPGTHWIGGWAGPKVILDAVVKRIPSLHRDSSPRTPIVQPAASCYTGWDIYYWRSKEKFVGRIHIFGPHRFSTIPTLHQARIECYKFSQEQAHRTKKKN